MTITLITMIINNVVIYRCLLYYLLRELAATPDETDLYKVVQRIVYKKLSHRRETAL